VCALLRTCGSHDSRAAGDDDSRAAGDDSQPAGDDHEQQAMTLSWAMTHEPQAVTHGLGGNFARSAETAQTAQHYDW
jgi:hypothetical protein